MKRREEKWFEWVDLEGCLVAAGSWHNVDLLLFPQTEKRKKEDCLEIKNVAVAQKKEKR